MAPRKHQRALLAGVLVAMPLTLLAGVAYAVEATAPYAWITLLLLPAAIAFVGARYVHAVDAILYASLHSAFSVFLICRFVLGLEHAVTMYLLAMGMFGAAVAGAILGLFARPWLRGRSDS